jgi:ribosomal protein L7/L12
MMPSALAALPGWDRESVITIADAFHAKGQKISGVKALLKLHDWSLTEAKEVYEYLT